MWWLIGAGVGVLQLLLNAKSRAIMAQSGSHPIQGLIAGAVLGAAIYGTLLWLVCGKLMGWLT